MKTIDIQAKSWFDKVNGNSYFAGKVTIDFGMESEKSFLMPFQYGYGDQYIQAARELLAENGFFVVDRTFSLFQYCRENGIILRYSKQENCLKRELKAVA